MNNMVHSLKENQIFVFGSNLAGHHIGGAAKQAFEQFGAITGKGKGLQGQSYAFPTLGKDMYQLTDYELRNNVADLYFECQGNRDKEFLLTKVGCGIAGYPEEQMKALFSNPPVNLVLPENWK